MAPRTFASVKASEGKFVGLGPGPVCTGSSTIVLADRGARLASTSTICPLITTQLKPIKMHGEEHEGEQRSERGQRGGKGGRP